MKDLYTYAVARIRAKELSLLSKHDIDRLMSCDNYENCIAVLKDKGWFDDSTISIYDYQSLLKIEESKIWDLIWELVKNKSAFNVILLPLDYHNLKAAIKAYISNSISGDLFYSGGTLSSSFIINCIKNNDFDSLPKNMIEPAKLAFEKLLHTSDGQLCDIIIDKALLETIKLEGKSSKNDLIKKYSEFYVASANIKIALRSLTMGKNVEFMNSAMVECDTLSIEKLIISAIDSFDSLCEYLEFTDYFDVVPFIKNSLKNFELWRDNKIMELIQLEKYNSFSVSPIIAYVLARQNEIKLARIILSSKLHNVDDNLIRERLRLTYV